MYEQLGLLLNTVRLRLSVVDGMICSIKHKALNRSFARVSSSLLLTPRLSQYRQRKVVYKLLLDEMLFTYCCTVQGFKHIETDCQLSKDVIPVVIHNELLEKTTNGTGVSVLCLFACSRCAHTFLPMLVSWIPKAHILSNSLQCRLLFLLGCCLDILRHPSM